jgi:endonuclease YncB( thermonuclease family)
MTMNRALTITGLITLFIAIPAQASDIYAEYVRNYDGDTVTVDLVDLRDIDLDGTFAPLWDNIGIRVAGVDTPEIRGKCPAEKVLAKEAKYLVRDALKAAEFITIRNAKRGKYFRIVGDIILEPGTEHERNLKDLLLDADLAVPYNGGRKTKSWCN